MAKEDSYNLRVLKKTASESKTVSTKATQTSSGIGQKFKEWLRPLALGTSITGVVAGTVYLAVTNMNGGQGQNEKIDSRQARRDLNDEQFIHDYSEEELKTLKNNDGHNKDIRVARFALKAGQFEDAIDHAQQILKALGDPPRDNEDDRFDLIRQAHAEAHLIIALSQWKLLCRDDAIAQLRLAIKFSPAQQPKPEQPNPPAQLEQVYLEQILQEQGEEPGSSGLNRRQLWDLIHSLAKEQQTMLDRLREPYSRGDLQAEATRDGYRMRLAELNQALGSSRALYETLPR